MLNEEKTEALPTRILRLPEVINRVGLKRASIYQYISIGAFPRSVSLGPRAVGWIEREVDVWLAERIQKSRKHSGIVENRLFK
ncbi:MAG: AlpA family transcriptional regulator [Bdellovibrionales bacterium]